MKKIISAICFISIILLGCLIFLKAPDGNWGPVSIFIGAVLLAFATFSFISLVFYKKDKKEAIAKLWLCTISTLLTYIVMDLVAGYLFIFRLSPPMIQDEYVHHKLAPSTYTHFKDRDFEYSQRVNSLGLRGPDIPLKKKPGTYRILLLGDSFTMGKGVNDDKTFSAVLERSLNRKPVAGNIETFEVLNAGVDSYAPILSFLQLRSIDGLLDPDAVVLNLDMSDLVQDTKYRTMATYGRNGEIIGVSGLPHSNEKRFKIAVRRWVDQHLYTSSLLLFYLEKGNVSSYGFESITPELLQYTLANDQADRTEQWRNLFASILDIKKYCDRHCQRFFLTVYPWGHQVNAREWVPGRRRAIPDGAVISDKSVHFIREFAEKNSIPFLNVFSAFRAYDGTRRLYFKYDPHWTDAGHELMAKELEGFLFMELFPSKKH